jgi:AcrR family transcriptional regulator
MSDIAAKAGLATGTLYIYFKNKDELINALFIECRKAAASCYLNNYDPKTDYREGFRTVWMNLLNYKLKNLREHIFIEQCYHSPFITESTRQTIKLLFEPLYQLMDKGKKEKRIKFLDSFLLLSYIVGIINEMVKHAHYSGNKITKEKAETIFELCWDGIKNDN